MNARRPGHGTVAAYLALFIALGGTSYAAVTLSVNSVKSKHIVNGQVKRPDIRNNAVNSAKVARGSLLASDFAAEQLPAGPKGDTGAQGAPGATNVIIRLGPTSTTPVSGQTYVSRVDCLSGERATGGGFTASTAGADDVVQINRPISGVSGGTLDDEAGRQPTGWSVQVVDTGSDGTSVRAWVVCASP
jgi:hypothetical protein